MELSEVISLIISGGFTLSLIFMGIRAYRKGVLPKKSTEEHALSMLLFETFTTNICALKPEENSGSQVRYVEKYFNNNINSEFTERKCGSDD